MQAARFFVSGRVQGVGFRAGARQQALALGLNGYARNVADGRVETFVQGDPADIEAFAHWLRRGPSLARVENVQRMPAATEESIGFGFG